MAANINNIKKIVEKGICNGCGTCFAVCPKLAIKILLNNKKGVYEPEVDNNKCNSCGLCLKVCPRYKLNCETMQQGALKRKPDSVLTGNYIECYSGYANDEKVRYNASSGGAITALLIFAIEKKLIDGVIVIQPAKDNSLLAESFIARTKEEVIAASQSKYCPAANIALKEAVFSAKEERLAFVGLPCQILGIRRTAQINAELKKKIILYLGLFCGYRPSLNGLEFFLEKNNIKKEEVKTINYRGDGWPGSVKILKKNGETINFPFPLYWSIAGSSFFCPKSCMACADCTSETADLSFGDAWLKEFKDDKIGNSIIVCRTKEGNDILKNAMETGILKLEKISSKKVIQSQIINIYLKKKGLQALFSKTARQGLKSDLIDRILSSIFLFNSIIGGNKFLRKFLSFIPLIFISLYTGFLSKIWFYKARSDFKKYIA